MIIKSTRTCFFYCCLLQQKTFVPNQVKHKSIVYLLLPIGTNNLPNICFFVTKRYKVSRSVKWLKKRVWREVNINAQFETCQLRWMPKIKISQKIINIGWKSDMILCNPLEVFLGSLAVHGPLVGIHWSKNIKKLTIDHCISNKLACTHSYRLCICTVFQKTLNF